MSESNDAPTTKYCPQCGKAGSPTDRYCPHCGADRAPKIPSPSADHLTARQHHQWGQPSPMDPTLPGWVNRTLVESGACGAPW